VSARVRKGKEEKTYAGRGCAYMRCAGSTRIGTCAQTLISACTERAATRARAGAHILKEVRGEIIVIEPVIAILVVRKEVGALLGPARVVEVALDGLPRGADPLEAFLRAHVRLVLLSVRAVRACKHRARGARAGAYW
jgi:hypothetical protein